MNIKDSIFNIKPGLNRAFFLTKKDYFYKKQFIKGEQNIVDKLEDDNELTKEQWELIEKARNEIKNDKYHTYDDIKKYFENKFE